MRVVVEAYVGEVGCEGKWPVAAPDIQHSLPGAYSRRDAGRSKDLVALRNADLPNSAVNDRKFPPQLTEP